MKALSGQNGHHKGQSAIHHVCLHSDIHYQPHHTRGLYWLLPTQLQLQRGGTLIVWMHLVLLLGPGKMLASWIMNVSSEIEQLYLVGGYDSS